MIAPWKIHTIKDWPTRYSLYGCWAIVTVSIISIFAPLPWYTIPLLMVLWMPFCITVMFRQWRDTRTQLKDLEAIGEAIDRADAKGQSDYTSELPPHLQEDFKMFVARKRLAQQENE